MKFDFYSDLTIKQIFVGNLKWSITILIRYITLFIILWTFILTILFIKPYASEKWNVKVSQGPTKNISQPTTTKYGNEIRDIDKTINMLKQKNE